ncbi:MAG: 4Fe-4S binding protein [Candidatus Coatesbacteria bacterium]
MRSTIARRISQGFFLALFLWFCIVSSVGMALWQLRGWPVDWFLQLDPLVALGTALTTWSLPGELWWALVTITLTLVLGRVFCGWICPMGTLQQIVGWWGNRRKPVAEMVALNRYRPAQGIKYIVLAVLLGGAALGLLQTGLLDPIPLAQRSVSLVVLGVVDGPLAWLAVAPRHYEESVLLGAVFLGLVLMCLRIPRFFCRFLCPTGALLGLLSRFSVWRIGKNTNPCHDCHLCDRYCEGACTPAGAIRTGECVMCMNCLDGCAVHATMTYATEPSAGGVDDVPDVTRRALLTAAGAGLVTVPLLRLTGRGSANWNPGLIRPPGSLEEAEFLGRCLKCGQCMRVCPTNVIQPAGLQFGASALWTPALNNRAGTSGCQLNCVACGRACPTGAIRALTLNEKQGRGAFKAAGPVRIGTAFLDRGRCLPWAMDRPCIVCEENCPVTPKAIHLEEEFRTVRGGSLTVAGVTAGTLRVVGASLVPDRYATGDFFCVLAGSGARRRITGNTESELVLDPSARWTARPAAGAAAAIQVRLQKPRVDSEACIGCGVCEHECVVNGLRAIMVSAENESRSDEHALAVRTKA